MTTEQPDRLNRILAWAVVLTGALVVLTGVATGVAWSRRPGPQGPDLVWVALGGETGSVDLHIGDPLGAYEPLTDTPDTEVHPSWSPDGSRLAFVRQAPDEDDASDGSGPGRLGVYLIEVDAPDRPETRLLETIDTDVSPPVWSPDGMRLAVLTIPLPGGRRADETPRLALLPAEGGAVRWMNLPDGVHLSWGRLDWSGDGRGLYFLAPNPDPDSDGAQSLWYHDLAEGTATERLANVQDFCCSPVAGTVAVIQQQETPSFVLLADDGAIQRVVEDHVLDPAWSPDGGRLAFGLHRGRSQFDIAVYDLNSDDIRTYTPQTAGRPLMAAWAPDGARLIYSSLVPHSDDAETTVELLDLVTGTVTGLRHEDHYVGMWAWRPQPEIPVQLVDSES
jgi:dipeptidyl aminopeptidase/acylaminoacyl peptidase